MNKEIFQNQETIQIRKTWGKLSGETSCLGGSSFYLLDRASFYWDHYRRVGVSTIRNKCEGKLPFFTIKTCFGAVDLHEFSVSNLATSRSESFAQSSSLVFAA